MHLLKNALTLLHRTFFTYACNFYLRDSANFCTEMANKGTRRNLKKIQFYKVKITFDGVDI